jgi:hypothetical protein
MTSVSNRDSSGENLELQGLVLNDHEALGIVDNPEVTWWVSVLMYHLMAKPPEWAWTTTTNLFNGVL